MSNIEKHTPKTSLLKKSLENLMNALRVPTEVRATLQPLLELHQSLEEISDMLHAIFTDDTAQNQAERQNGVYRLMEYDDIANDMETRHPGTLARLFMRDNHHAFQGVYTPGQELEVDYGFTTIDISPFEENTEKSVPPTPIRRPAQLNFSRPKTLENIVTDPAVQKVTINKKQYTRDAQGKFPPVPLPQKTKIRIDMVEKQPSAPKTPAKTGARRTNLQELGITKEALEVYQDLSKNDKNWGNACYRLASAIFGKIHNNQGITHGVAPILDAHGTYGKKLDKAYRGTDANALIKKYQLKPGTVFHMSTSGDYNSLAGSNHWFTFVGYKDGKPRFCDQNGASIPLDEVANPHRPLLAVYAKDRRPAHPPLPTVPTTKPTTSAASKKAVQPAGNKAKSPPKNVPTTGQKSKPTPAPAPSPAIKKSAPQTKVTPPKPGPKTPPRTT